MIKKIAFVTAMALSVCGSARADGIDPIKMRQTGLDLLAGTFSGIRTAIDAKVDVKKLESAGAAIQRWSTVFPTLFPPGSDKGDTKAAPSIW